VEDRDLILKALQLGAPPKRTRKRVKPIFQDSMDVGPDAVFKPKKTRRPMPKREKTIAEWSGSDFVRYYTKCLSQFGIMIETNLRDSDWVMKVYDLLVDEFGGSMNNYVLRDYIDWWVGTHASVQSGKEIGVFSLNRGSDIERFVKHYALRAGKPQSQKTPKVEVDISAEEMYKKSGLTMVLMEFGIAEAYRVMVAKGETTIFARISDALKNCSKQIVEQILDRTMTRRYNLEYLVDFMSVARPALKFHRLEKQFDHVDYKQYFTEA